MAMPTRSAKSRVVGVLSMSYGLIDGLFWAWKIWGDSETQRRGDSGGTLLVMLFVVVPALVVVSGYALCSTRISDLDARALKGAAVAGLAVKVAGGGYWALGLVSASGNFSGLLHVLGWNVGLFEVLPSAICAVVLATTSLPAAEPAADEPAQEVLED